MSDLFAFGEGRRQIETNDKGTAMAIDRLTRTARPVTGRRLQGMFIPVMLMLFCVSASLTFAANAMSQSTDFNIAPQPVESALHEWSRQSSVQVMVASDAVTNQRTDGVKGRLTAAAALSQLLQRTNLTYEAVGDRTVAVKRVAAVTETQRASPQSSHSRQEDATSDEDSDGKRGRGIEEIIVTAQKRAERLQDVPISITAVGGADLDKSTAQSMTEVLNRVPGVSVNQSFLGGGSQVPIRGVSAGLAVFTGSSPTAYYLDSVPFGFSKTAIGPDPDVYDLERIEVLRGPQGTLYGANALNGVVRILTHDANPNALEFKARASGSSTKGGGENYRGDMAVNVPIIEGKVAARAVLGYQDLSGWIDKPNKKNVNDAERKNARIKINAQPTDQLSIGLSAWLSRSDYGGPPAGDDEGRRSSLIDEPTSSDYDTYGLQVRYDFPAFSVTSATSYLDYENHWILDIAPAFGIAYDGRIPAKTFAEEVLLSSTGAGPWRWTAGTMYRDSKDSLLYFIDTVNVVRSDDSRISKSYAVFGELTRQFMDGKFELTAGLRYFEDKIDQREHARANGAPQSLLVRDEDKFHATTPRAVAAWHPNEQISLYASYSEGFRSGGVQAPSVLSNFPGFPPADPDTLKNYEVGVKGSALEGRLNFEAAAFYIDWQDVQQFLTIFAPALHANVAAIVNGQSASGPGAELSFSIVPVDRLELGLNFSWNDLTFDDDVVTFPSGGPASGLVLFEKGDRLSWSSEYTAGAYAGYSMPVGSAGLEAGFSASVNYTSGESHPALLSNQTTVTRSDGILLGGLSLFVRARDRWIATLFVDNVSDEDGTPARNESFSDWDMRVRPRTVGLQLEYSY